MSGRALQNDPITIPLRTSASSAVDLVYRRGRRGAQRTNIGAHHVAFPLLLILRLAPPHPVLDVVVDDEV